MLRWLKAKYKAWKQKREQRFQKEIKALKDLLLEEAIKFEITAKNYNIEMVEGAVQRKKLEELLTKEKENRAAERSGYFRDINALKEEKLKLTEQVAKLTNENNALKQALGMR